MRITLFYALALIYLLFTVTKSAYAGGGGIIAPGKEDIHLEIEQLLKLIEDQSIPIDLDLFIKQFNSPSGTDLILKYDALKGLQNTGNFEVIGVDPATFTNLSHTFESTPTLNSVQVKNFNFTVPVDAIHTDASERFIVLETSKTFDALAKDILIAPVFGQ